MAFKHWAYNAYNKMSSSDKVRLRQPTPTGKLVFAGAVICGIVGMNTDNSLIYQLFSLLVCFYLISRYTLFISRPNIQVRRILPRYATANCSFSYQIILFNSGNKPESDLVVDDRPKTQRPGLKQFLTMPEPFEETRNAYDRFIGFHRYMYLTRQATGITIAAKTSPDIAKRSTVKLTLKAMPLRRGPIQFASINVLHPDPFNLIQGIQNHPLSDLLVVFPKRYPLSANLLYQGRNNLLNGNQNRGRTIGESDEFVSIRDYRDGDSIKKIHWPSTAKRNKPVVREFQDESTSRISILLDASSPYPQVSEEAIATAASLVHHLAEQNSATDLICNETLPKSLSSDHGTARQLEVLALLNVDGVESLAIESLKKYLTSKRRQMSYLFLVFARWSDQHKALMDHLHSLDCAATLLLITNETTDDAITKIGLPQAPSCQTHIIPINQIAKKLASL